MLLKIQPIYKMFVFTVPFHYSLLLPASIETTCLVSADQDVEEALFYPEEIKSLQR